MKGRQVVVGACVLGAFETAALAMLRLQGPSQLALARLALALLFVGLVVAIGGLWVRRTESVLTIVLVLLYFVPQNYVLVGPLRSVGNPALLGALFALVLWCSGRMLGLVTPWPHHPGRWLVMLYVLGACTAFAAGMMRPLSASESSGAVRAIFPVAGLVGIALFACDGLRETSQIERLLQRLVWIGGGAALIGALEFFIPAFNWRTLAHLPGLTTNTELITDTRSGFSRVMAAAAHPIEYSVALAAMAPLALHFAMNARTRARRRSSAVALVAVVAVTPMTVSRSGVVCLLAGLLWYMVHLNGRARLNLAVLGIFGLALMRAAIPGLLGTIRSLLFVGEQDPSIHGRTIDYAKIPGLLDGHLWFGRGLGTFQPDQYFFLDNQYLGSLLEGGLFCLGVLIALYVIAMGMARGARRLSSSQSVRSLGQAMSASILSLAIAGATFDELSFRQTSFLLFFLIGCSAALWSAVRRERATPTQLNEPSFQERAPAHA